MIPGPYSICHISFLDESDAPTFKTLCFGYDSAEAAYLDLSFIASQQNMPADECTVIRLIETEEASQFSN
jgi:hypothetical protein